MSRTTNGSGSGSGNGSAGRAGSLAPAPRYPGDDTRPTSPRELAGWYAYSFAAEVYVICGQSGAKSHPAWLMSRS
jgi:UMF1 family MFS transporter